MLSFADRVVVQDHHDRSVHILSLFDPSKASSRCSAEQWVAEACASVAARSHAQGGAAGLSFDLSGGRAAQPGACAHADSTQAGWGEATSPRVHASTAASPPAERSRSNSIADHAVVRSHQLQSACGRARDAQDLPDEELSACCGHAQERNSSEAATHVERAGEARSAANLSTAAYEVSHSPRLKGAAHAHARRPVVPSSALSAQSGASSPTQPAGRRHDDAASAADSPPLVDGGALRLARSKAQYMADIAACMDALHRGDSYEICLTNALSCRVRGWDAWAFYQVLRHINPAPHSAWLHCGEVRTTACAR